MVRPGGEKKKEAPKQAAPTKLPEGVVGIIRIAESDIFGTKKVKAGLLRIRGVGQTVANMIPKIAGLNPNDYIGRLTEEQVEKIEDILKNPQKYNIPNFMLNRRNDPSTGESRHVSASELPVVKKDDIDRMKKMRCYKGIRHELGLPVRGQRTRSSFRTGAKVGVVKAKLKPATAAAPAPGAKSAPAAEKKK